MKVGRGFTLILSFKQRSPVKQTPVGRYLRSQLGDHLGAEQFDQGRLVE